MVISPLNAVECNRLADALGDTVETAISYHLLRRGLCEAYLLGNSGGEHGAIICDPKLCDEPTGFGTSPELIVELLQSLTGWFCVNVATELGMAVGALIEQRMGVKVRYYGDLYFALTTPVKRFEKECVRQLSIEDLALLEASPEFARAAGFGGPRQLLEESFMACGIIDGKIVASAQAYARSERYADIGVVTLPEYRGRGFATAAASIVAQRLQEAGEIPLWSTGEDNYASQRIAQKLGFTEAGRRVYVIVEEN